MFKIGLLIGAMISPSHVAFASETLTLQMGCVASVCGKKSGAGCKEVPGRRLQTVAVQLKDFGGWPRRLHGSSNCSMTAKGIFLNNRIDIIKDPTTGVINIIPFIESARSTSVKQTSPGEIYLKDISNLTYHYYKGESIEIEDLWIVPALVIDSEQGTF